MDETLTRLLVFLAGVLLGVVFFGGLWWTIQRWASAPRPALSFLLSFLLRSSLALAGFLLVCGRYWERWLLCLLGFVAARFVVTWFTRPAQEGMEQGASHAP